MEDLYTTYYSSPLGLLEITGSEKAIYTVSFVEAREKEASTVIPETLNTCLEELNDYFKSGRREFSVPVVFEGTAFQQQVWSELTTIPFGKTLSYIALARKLNNPNAVRAIGNTNSRNKICILVPCHRVIGNDGSLVGYAGGVWRKRWLIEHELAFSGFKQLKLF